MSWRDDDGRRPPAGPPIESVINTPPNTAAVVKPQHRLHFNAHQPSCGRYAFAWRQGFGHGFRDALRLAARRLPPETWHTLDRLAGEFDLAANDE